ncbi:MAG: hypothetical protein WBA46_13265, partial [Thermomicrobiales bacterium]
VALRQIPGVEVTFRAIAADRPSLAAIDAVLADAGVASQVSVRDDGDASPIRLGDTLDIWGLFAHDLVILDADDAPLRAFLTDLPAHTAPGVRILGTMGYVTAPMPAQELDIAMRFDAIIGSIQQARHLVDQQPTGTLASAAEAIAARMKGANLRAVAIHDRQTLVIASQGEGPVAVAIPPDVAPATVVAAVAVTLARRAPWDAVGDFLAPEATGDAS